MMKVYKKTLPNGLRIITVPMKDTSTATAYVLVETGSKYEIKTENGISHFLEHVCFKGTVKRPSSKDINIEFDSIGAQSNAFTSQEFTGYYAKAQSKNLPKILDVLSDIYLNSTFPKAEVEKERGVIVEELNMYEDLPQRRVQEHFDSLLYGDQPAGWSIGGSKDVVKTMTSDKIRAYRKKHYVASSTIVLVAGNVLEKDVVSLVKKMFKDISVSKKHSKKKVIEKQTKPELVVYKKNIEQSHIVLGVRTFKVGDKRGATLALLNTILGEGMSARLFQRLREDLGMAYYVRSTVDESTDHGALKVSSGVDTNRVPEAIEAILGEFRRLKDETVREDELFKAKEFYVGNMYLGLETSDSLGGYYGIQEILKRKLESPIDIEKKIRAVTSKDIQKLAKEIFVDKSLNLAIVGKSPEEAILKSVLKI
jgi:predicted Zn-dependent peptidase